VGAPLAALGAQAVHRAIPARKLHRDLQQTAQATRGVVAQVVDLAGRIGVNDPSPFRKASWSGW
jgi:hypothetical protein